MSMLINIPGLGPKRFSNLRELRDWMVAEKDKYKWLDDRLPRHLSQIVQNWRNTSSNGWIKAIDKAKRTISNYSDETLNQDAIESIQAELSQQIGNDAPALWSETVDGAFILDAAQSRGSPFALGSLIYLSNAEIDLSNAHKRDFWDGWISAFLHANGLQKTVPRRYRRIDNLAEEFRTELADIHSNGQAALNDIRQSIETAQATIESIAARSDRTFAISRRLRKRFLQHAERTLDDLRRDVHEHIAMHSSVEYWNEKSRAMDTEARTWGSAYFRSIGIGVLLVVAAVTLGGLFLLFAEDETLKHINDRFELIANFYIVATSGVAIVLGMWLWVTRMFGRLYLDARTQRDEAERRVTMIKSYLAMLSDEGAFEKDSAREIILPAIFSPSTSTATTDAGGPPLWVDRLMRALGAR